MPNNAELQRATARARRQAGRMTAELVANPRVQFADWLKRTHPPVFDAAMAYAQAPARDRVQAVAAARAAQAKAAGVFDTELGGLWDDLTGSLTEGFENIEMPTTTDAAQEKSLWEKILDGAVVLGTGLVGLKQQEKLLELNIERAKAGLPPLDAGAIAPVIKTEVAIDPATAAALASNVGSSINRGLLVMGGVALVVLFFVMRK